MSPAESNRPSLPAGHSTGPRTPEGKRKSSLNALRHGLTGRVVVLPWEDMDAWRAFCKGLMAELAPRTSLEQQCALTFCEAQWRLNRVRSHEEGIYVLEHIEPRPEIDLGHPEANAAVMAARAFRDHPNSFANLSLYEQRLHRVLKESFSRLRELQAQPLPALHASAAGEFVFANDRISDPADPAPLTI